MPLGDESKASVEEWRKGNEERIARLRRMEMKALEEACWLRQYERYQNLYDRQITVATTGISGASATLSGATTTSGNRIVGINSVSGTLTFLI